MTFTTNRFDFSLLGNSPQALCTKTANLQSQVEFCRMDVLLV